MMPGSSPPPVPLPAQPSGLLAAWGSQLRRAEPAPVALVVLLGFPVAMLLTSKSVLQELSTAANSSCLAPYSAPGGGIDPRPFSIAAAGLAGGCFLYSLAVATVLRMHRRPRTVLRYETISIVGCALLESFLFYTLVSNDALFRVCVSQSWLGTAPRVVTVARYCFWTCTTTTLLAMMGKLSGASQQAVQLTLVANANTMAWGLAAALVESSLATWACLFTISMLCSCFVTVSFVRFLRGAYEHSCDDLTRQLLRMVGPIATLIWVLYPAFWLACALGWVPVGTEQAFWPILDLLEKAIISLHMTAGDFSLAATEGEAVLQAIDDARHAAELADEAKRDVIRYLFHEIRVPLNSIVLAVEDVSSTLASELVSPTSAAESSSRPPSAEPDSERKKAMIVDLLGTLHIASTSSVDMTRLLDGFLTMDKVESGMMSLQLESTPVGAILQETANTFAAALVHHSLRVTLGVDVRVPLLVVLDPNRIRQCVNNYLSNAIKFSPVGGTIALRAELVDIDHTSSPSPTTAAWTPVAAAPDGPSLFRRLGKRTASVSPYAGGPVSPDASPPAAPTASRGGTNIGGLTRSDSSGNSSAKATTSTSLGSGATPMAAARTPSPLSAPQSQVLRISVTDNGPGISSADQRKLFSTFVQLRPGAQQSAGGFGLGLAICRRIVELHGGRVGVRSVAGSYCCFYMDLPLNLAQLHITSIRREDNSRTASRHSDATAGGGVGLVGSPLPPVPVQVSADGRVEAREHRDHRFPLTIRVAAAGAVAHPAAAGAAEAAARRRNSNASDDERTPLAQRGESGASDDPTATGQSSVLLSMASGSPAWGPPLHSHPLPPRCPSPVNGVLPVHQLTSALVVDDVESNRLLLARLLQRRGVATVLALNGGNAALTAWRSKDPAARAALQCVFCDKEMPDDLDGHDTVRALRTEGYTGPIVGVTGNALDGDETAFIDAGASVVLRKPVTGDGLERVLLAVGLSLPAAAARAPVLPRPQWGPVTRPR